MMMQSCRLHRRANAWTIKAVTVERCMSLSTFCAGAQTLPWAWRGSATLLEKAEGLLSLAYVVRSTRRGQVRDTEQC